jgi:CheY-like chemotaxis protein
MVGEQISTGPKNQTPTVLVVDDEVLVRMVIAESLRDCGYHAIEAADAAEAIEVLSSETQVDILFTDIEMPGTMNGFGLARWARENVAGVHILLTSGNPGKAEEARELCL